MKVTDLDEVTYIDFKNEVTNITKALQPPMATPMINNVLKIDFVFNSSLSASSLLVSCVFDGITCE